MANLADLISASLGVATEARVNRAASTVGTAVQVILRGDPKRLAAVVVNLSAVAMYVSPVRSVSATAGIRLAPNGGQMTLLWDEDFDMTGWEWYAIADAAASAVFTVEVLAR